MTLIREAVGAAVDLPGEEERIEGDAEIVDDDIVLDSNAAGVRIDFDIDACRSRLASRTRSLRSTGTTSMEPLPA